MTSWRKSRTALTVLLAAGLAGSPAQGLVTLNDGRDRIYVTGTFGVSHDSNIYANSDNAGDLIYTAGVTADYVRRAGWIGMNASVSVSASSFQDNQDQNFTNPHYSLELTKQGGRTTGSITISGARESRADAAVNMRSTSWVYNGGLQVRYPAGPYTFAGHLGYSNRVFAEDTVFTNLATYTNSLDVYRILPAERELIAGYRYRYSNTARDTSSSDYAVNVGLSGRLLRGVKGSLRGGFQTRVRHGGPPGDSRYNSWTASAMTTYAVSRKLNFSGQLAKDFSTTATDDSVDVINAALSAAYALSSRWSLSASAGWGDSRFLGGNSRSAIAGDPTIGPEPERHDTFVNGSAAINYTLSEHLNASFAYTWFENWSTLTLADFTRSSWGMNVSSRW